MDNSSSVRKAEQHAVQVNPEGFVAPLSALRSVVLFSISDAFGLVAEEIMWAGYHLDEVLAPLLGKEPESVPLPVRQEMMAGVYSKALERMERSGNRAKTPMWDPNATHASAADWAAVTVQMVSESYPLRPLEESAMHGKIVGLLRELGVDDPKNPRPARYLPSDIRHRLGSRGRG